MELAAVLAAFGFQAPWVPESLYSYAPVYRVRDGRGDWVVKRTGLVHSSGAAIGRWLAALQASGVNVVAPAPVFGQNPRVMEDGLTWVVYPYVAGVPYTGTPTQIRAAGDLLGRMHAADVPEAHDLKTYEAVVWRERAWVERQAEGVREHLPSGTRTFWSVLGERLTRAEEARRSPPLAPGLPLAGGSFDFKASNLVYAASGRPVLVDPDHAARFPRLSDLATALLLFHCDAARAPGRIWTPAEWRIFLGAYARHVFLTVQERNLWGDVLLGAWLDQGVWLLGNFPEGWADPREREYLSNLAALNLGDYVLSTPAP